MSNQTIPTANRISKLCLNKFDSLPKTGKPIFGKEWTVYTCIVKYNNSNEDLEVVSLGTGTKCIGQHQLGVNGDILNDSHAEVICRRAFLRYIYSEILNTKGRDASTIFKFDNELKKFVLDKNTSFHLFTTHAPCGDASIFPINNGNEINLDIPKKRLKLDETSTNTDEVGDILTSSNENAANFTGAKIIANNFDVPQDLMIQDSGNIRTKPGRGVRTLSMSCSDKLARWNVIGVQGALISNLIDAPIFLKSMTLSSSSYRQANIVAMERAIWKRFENIEIDSNDWLQIQKPTIIICVDGEFKFTKADNLEPSPCSIIWCNVKERPHEVAVAGKKQGATKKNLHTIAGRLKISKIELFQKYVEMVKEFDNVLQLYQSSGINIETLSYSDAKRSSKKYVENWSCLKKNYFMCWTKKPDYLNAFRLK